VGGLDGLQDVRSLHHTYGAGPLHLLGLVACFALSGYAVTRFFDHPEPWNVLIWLALAIVAHDLVLFPLYSALGRAAERLPQHVGPVRLINYVRVPALLSGLLLLVWFPLILDLAPESFERVAGRSPDVYLERYLLITGGVFLVSALALGMRLVRNR